MTLITPPVGRFGAAFELLVPRIGRLREQIAELLRENEKLLSDRSSLSKQVEELLSDRSGLSKQVEELLHQCETLRDHIVRQEMLSSQVGIVAQLMDKMPGHMQKNTERLLSKLAAMEYRRTEAPGQAMGAMHASLYLGLLEAVLTGMIYKDVPIGDGWNAGAYDEETRLLGRDWPSTAYTMIGAARLRNLRDLLERAITEGIPGDFIETGVWRGGACIFARAIFEAHGVRDRTVWVADSFCGLPMPDSTNFPADIDDPHHSIRELAVPAATVRENFARFGLLDEQVRFLEGWFKDTLASAPIERLAVLRLDGDMYESTMQALEALYPKVSPGGFVIIDDYILPPCRHAVDDFRRKFGIEARLEEVDGAAVFLRVP